MPRKNTWLPGKAGFGHDLASDEPGRLLRNWEIPALGSRMPTPLGDLIASAVFVVVAAALAYWAWAFAGPLNLPALLIVSGAIVVMLALAVWHLAIAIRRIRWRRKNIAVTGGRYLRAWERTPLTY